MRRFFSITACCAIFALAACGDDDAKPVIDGGAGDSTVVIPDAGATCDETVLGQACTASGGECGVRATCLITDGDAQTGLCVCENCTVDDPETMLVDEDDCPGDSVCGGVEMTDGSIVNFCFKTCTPKLNDNECGTGIACDPRSGSIIDSLDPICILSGCETDEDCPVVTKDECQMDGSVACPTGQKCYPYDETNTDGVCAYPGKCEATSGLCVARDDNFNANAKIGDPCTDTTDCGATMICQQEYEDETTKRTQVRNGYCMQSDCAAAASIPEYACPAGSACHPLYFGGLCFKTCDVTDASTCRGVANDQAGDYECRNWTNVINGGAAMCEFGETIDCGTLVSWGIPCTAFGVTPDSNPTNMGCRTVDQQATSENDANGYCFDDTTSAGGTTPPADAGVDTTPAADAGVDASGS